MRNDSFGEGLEGWNFGGIYLGAPLCQEGVSTSFIRHIPEVVEDGFQAVGFAQRGIESNQLGQLLLLTIRKRVGILQEGVFVALQRLMFLALGFTHRVHGFIEQFDDMKTVEGDLGVGEGIFDADNEGGRQVHAGLLNLFGWSALAFQMIANGLHARFALAFADMNHASSVHVDTQCDVVVALAGRGFINTEPGDSGWIVGFEGLAYPMIKDGPDALWINPHQFGDSVDGHLAFDQGQRQGLEQQGKTTARTRPGYRHGHDFAG